MKCPKCGYLGFEEVDRCRNCGYDFSLASGPLVPELALHPNRSDVGILDDLNFVSENSPPQGATAADLPLFGGSAAEDQPLITRVSPPRPPLAVRRATPEVPRARSAARSSLDLALETEPIATASMTRRRTGHLGSADAHSHRTEATTDDASLSARFVALALDALILLVIDVVVVYLTLQFCGLTLREIDVLPKIPLLAFLFVQNMGYLTAFTVGGQTLGKMAVGIKVVAADAAEPLDLGRSIRRSLLWVALALPAGLGFLTALLTRDHRGLHDRLAGTRVVRASA